jgi:hypothetical protein
MDAPLEAAERASSSWRLIIVSLSPVQATCVTAARSVVTDGLLDLSRQVFLLPR